MAAAQIAGLNCLKLMNETTAGKGLGLFLSFEAVQCEGDDTLLLHNGEFGRELSRLVLPNPVWELETQHWGGVCSTWEAPRELGFANLSMVTPGNSFGNKPGICASSCGSPVSCSNGSTVPIK